VKLSINICEQLPLKMPNMVFFRMRNNSDSLSYDRKHVRTCLRSVIHRAGLSSVANERKNNKYVINVIYLRNIEKYITVVV